MDRDKALDPVAKEPTLTKRNRSFLNHLAAGRPTLEAYRLAGFKGEPHAAYELRSKLRMVLAQMLEARGIDRADLMVQAKTLVDLPLDPQIQSVTVKQKVDILRLYDKILGSVEGGQPQITPIALNFGDVNVTQTAPAASALPGHLNDQPPVDAEVVPPPPAEL